MATKPTKLPSLRALHKTLAPLCGDPLKASLAPGKSPAWAVYNCSFVELAKAIPDGYFDAVIADPPYNTAALPLYWQTYFAAARLLRPGGYLTMIMPTYIQDPFAAVVHLGPAAMAAPWPLKEDPPPEALRAAALLRYRWTIGMLQLTGAQARLVNAERNLRVTWKPIGWWIKRPSPDRCYTEAVDSFSSAEPSKASHRWKQSVEWARYNCQLCAPLADLPTALGRPLRVFDPMVGTGTLPYIATREFGFECISCDIDPRAYGLTVECLSETVHPMAAGKPKKGQERLF